ncbi:S8 family serine peptidase [Nitrososphaera sp.]|uniref:S8 family peptidase n=1 Tax=Nitrososphaera sp. TaxID=1971748 RepID=UPI00307F7E1A
MNTMMTFRLIAAIVAASILLGATYATASASAQNSALTEEEMAKKKVEPELYNKIKKMKDSGETRDYKVMIHVYPDFASDSSDLNDAKKNKDALEKELLISHKAKNIYKAQVLSFIAADIPVSEVFTLARYDYVSLIGDREIEGYALGSGSFELANLKGIDQGKASLTNKPNPIGVDQNILRPTINADGTGYTGSGIKVAVIDTGIKQDHPDLPVGTKIVYQADCTGTSCIEYTSANSAVADSSDHGTHVAGIIAAQGSSNPYRGVAYNAQIINAKINTNIGNLGIALDWAITKGAKVANVSVGASCTSGYNSIARVADEAIDKGVIVVAAIGKGSAVSIPGCAFNVITVGAIDDKNTSSRTDDTLVTDTTYTTTGPTGDGRTKPDVVAPGWNIYSQSGVSGVTYSDKSGASFATAAVSGAVAQLLEKNPGWTPAQIKAAIKQMAYLNSNLSPLTENQRGKGIVDVGQALTLTSSTIDYSLAYGINLSTYTAQSGAGDSVTYNIGKETNGSNIGSIYVHNGNIKGTKTFNKMSFSGIKISGISYTLTDDKLFSGPRVDGTGSSHADTYVKYKIGSDTVQLIWFVYSGAIQPYAKFDSGSGSKSFEATQYLDFDIASTNANDKATLPSSPYTAYNTEQKFTSGTAFNIRDNSPIVTPWLNFNYGAGTTITEWILKWKSTEAPTNNPDGYYSSTESINPSGSGDNILVYYRDSKTTTSYYSGPTVYVNWSSPP